MSLLVKCARWLFGEYGLYFVYRLQAQNAAVVPAVTHALIRPQESDLLRSPRAILAEQAWYLGPECEAFALADDAGLAAVCFYWHGQRYRQRGFWPLTRGEAKLVQIVVDPSARGKGLAAQLIQASAAEMGRNGWQALYARIWHSNHPSLRAFERAGWERIAFVVEVFPFGWGRKLRLQLPARRRGHR
jgi:GNAT superfamily N-acetyltransferase